MEMESTDFIDACYTEGYKSVLFFSASRVQMTLPQRLAYVKGSQDYPEFSKIAWLMGVLDSLGDNPSFIQAENYAFYLTEYLRFKESMANYG